MFCGYSLVVELLVANQIVGVRFSLSAQKRLKSSPAGGF